MSLGHLLRKARNRRAHSSCYKLPTLFYYKIVIKVFIKRTVVSVETILSAYMRVRARTHVHRGTHTSMLAIQN